MWHSSPSPKYGPDVGRPLVRLGEQHPVGPVRVDVRANRLEHDVRLGQVLAAGALALHEVRHGVETEAIHAHRQPEVHHLEHLGEHRRVVVVQIGLVMEEPVPVVRLGHGVPGPVGLLGVDEDDPRLLVPPGVVAPDVELALGRPRRREPRSLEPLVLIGGVIDDELDEHAEAALVRRREEALEIVDRAVARMDRGVIGDVVAVVAQRGREAGQQPQAGDPEPLQVVELLDQAREVADAVVVAVEERLDGQLVDDGVLVPERVQRPPSCGDRAHGP